MQIEKAINKNMNEKEYFKMISDKTASLISASCYLGLYSTNKDKELCNAIKDFGEYLGIAYQMKDDLLDWMEDERLTDLFKNKISKRDLNNEATEYAKNAKKELLKLRKNDGRDFLEYLGDFNVMRDN